MGDRALGLWAVGVAVDVLATVRLVMGVVLAAFVLRLVLRADTSRGMDFAAVFLGAIGRYQIWIYRSDDLKKKINETEAML
jgi:hypothetical protein